MCANLQNYRVFYITFLSLFVLKQEENRLMSIYLLNVARFYTLYSVLNSFMVLDYSTSHEDNLEFFFSKLGLVMILFTLLLWIRRIYWNAVRFLTYVFVNFLNSRSNHCFKLIPVSYVFLRCVGETVIQRMEFLPKHVFIPITFIWLVFNSLLLQRSKVLRFNILHHHWKNYAQTNMPNT